MVEQGYDVVLGWQRGVDAAFARLAEAAPGLPPPPPEPTPDAGAGPYASQPATWDDYREELRLRGIAFGGSWTGRPDAARHLNHYLDGTGQDLVVDPDAIAADVPSFQREVESRAVTEINRLAREAAATGRFGEPIPIVTDWRGISIPQTENDNWYYAVGSINQSTTGTVTVHPPDTPGGAPRVEADYQTHVWDRYNWDTGKSVELNGEVVPDTRQGRLHLTGLAQEFDVTGSAAPRHYTGTVPP